MRYFLYPLTLLLLTSAASVSAAPPAGDVSTITLPAGTRIHVRLAQSVDTNRDRPGSPFLAHVLVAIVRHGEVMVPRGTPCHGHLVESRPSGRLRGRAVMRLSLDSLELRGRTYRIVTSDPSFVSANHKKRNLALIGGGTGTGAAIGAIAGGPVGAAIGAGAGAAAGTTTAYVTGKRNLHLAPETRVVFALRRAVRISN